MENHYVWSHVGALENLNQCTLCFIPAPTPLLQFFFSTCQSFLLFLKSGVCPRLLSNPHSPPALDHHYFMVTTAKAASDYHLPQHLLLPLTSRSSSASALLGLSRTCNMKLSLTPSRNPPDSSCPTAFLSQPISERLKPHRRNRVSGQRPAGQ